jgi:hypothetical protein
MSTQDYSTVVVNDDQLGKCKYCNKAIAWLTSFKKGTKYPVNVDVSSQNPFEDITVTKTDFHKCTERERALTKPM